MSADMGTKSLSGASAYPYPGASCGRLLAHQPFSRTRFEAAVAILGGASLASRGPEGRRRVAVSVKLSLEQVLANLEAQVAFHKEREAEHARQEVWHQEQALFHKEQRARHAAEHEEVCRHYETFKATALPAAEVAARAVVPPPPAVPEEPPLAEPPLEEEPLEAPYPRARLVARWVEKLPAGEVFGAARAVEEVNRRYARDLAKPATFRQASATLRRLCDHGVIRLVRQGGAHQESLYTKG